MKKLLLWSFLLLPTVASAQLNTQLLKCVGSFQLELCEIVPSTFFSNSPAELEFDVDFVHNCTGSPVSIGIKDESNNSFHKFERSPNMQNMKFNGHGSLKMFDTTPRLTKFGGFAVGCDVRVTRLETDVSSNTRNLLDSQLKLLESYNLLITQAKDIDSLATTIDTLLTKIDLASLKSLFVNLYNNTVKLRESYTSEDETDVADALDDVVADLKNKICGNPPLRAGNETICGPQTGTPASDPVTEISSSLTKIKNASKLTIETLKTGFSNTIVDASAALAVAKVSTKTTFMTKICSELDKAGVVDISCEAY